MTDIMAEGPTRMRGVIVVLAICAAGCDSPVAPTDATAFVSIAAGAEHSCAATATGTAWCWGRGSEGQLGNLEFSDASRPVRVAGAQFVQMDGGRRHTCGVTSAGQVLCWGWGHYGQLGNGTPYTTAGVTPVNSTDSYISVSAGGNHTCAITDGGIIHCWGENSQGQLGDGTTVSRPSPAPIAADSMTFVEVSAGAFHTCGRSTAGDVYCWGLNHLGQLGTGDLVSVDVPTAVASSVTFQSVSAGVSHTCGISTQGASYCWGSAEFGELGTGGTVERGFSGAMQPSQALLGYPFISVVAADVYTCGVQPGGMTACWGRGTEGQFGNGQPLNMPVPLPNTYGPRATAIALGATHGCLISTAGQVMCWGSGSRGQLGTARSSSSTLPTRVNIPRD